MLKIQPIRVAYHYPVNFKFDAPFKEREGLPIDENPVFDFSVLSPKKSGLSKKIENWIF